MPCAQYSSELILRPAEVPYLLQFDLKIIKSLIEFKDMSVRLCSEFSNVSPPSPSLRLCLAILSIHKPVKKITAFRTLQKNSSSGLFTIFSTTLYGSPCSVLKGVATTYPKSHSL